MDIDPHTPNATPVTDLASLKATVAAAAQLQLTINEAEAACQAAVEDARKKFDQATAPLTKQLQQHFAGIYAYADTNRELLFPGQGKKQKRTFAVLGHDLSLQRAAPAVDAPGDIIPRIRQQIAELNAAIDARFDLSEPGLAAAFQEQIDTLESFIRHHDPDLNKPAVKAKFKDLPESLQAALGIDLHVAESFLLKFKFSPNA